MFPFIHQNKTRNSYNSYKSSYNSSYKPSYKSSYNSTSNINNNYSKPLTPRTIHAINKYVNTLHQTYNVKK